MPTPSADHLRTHLAGTRAALDALDAQAASIVAMATRLRDVLDAGGTLYTCGNGGSAAEALHLAEELIGCYADRTRPPRRAVCLNADPTALTCIANDFGFEKIFERQCAALLTERDALAVFSTSGNSPNIVAALETARARGAVTLGLLGGDGGRCRALCDEAIVIPGRDSAHTQEAHQVVMHYLCAVMEPG